MGVVGNDVERKEKEAREKRETNSLTALSVKPRLLSVTNSNSSTYLICVSFPAIKYHHDCNTNLDGILWIIP